MKYKRITSGVLALIFLLSIPLSTLADSNVDTGEGGTHDAVHGFYRSSEWLYKVSLYVGLSDKADTDTPISGYKLIGKPVYVRPPFPMPSNVGFTEYNKIQYLNQAPLKPADSIIEVEDSNVPRIPITHQGSLGRVKNYFGDTNTLNLILERIARHYGTTKSGLVSNIDFTIANQTGKFLPEDILPSKGEDGRYQNLVPWVIIYEPVTIAHLRDGKTRIAFTATEYAIAQKTGMFNFFYSGEDAQWIANMTHANLPNSLVLEQDWFGFKAYPPLGHNVKWSDDRIVHGGGWGMRILRPGEKPPPPPPKFELMSIDIGDYRTDTDVVTSFWVESDYEINPDNPGYVDFYVDGVRKHRQEFVLPEGGSQVVWFKWHTPKNPTTAIVSASPSKGYIVGSPSKTFIIKDLDEYEPPDPRAKDPETGKVVEKPEWFEMVNPPSLANQISNEWSVWSAYWQENWVWHEDWVWIEDWKWITTGVDEDGNEEGYWVDDGYWEDQGEWVDEGEWIYYQNHYDASISNYNLVFKPDERVPTAKQWYGRWEMGSGYGYNIETTMRVSTNDRSAVAQQGNSITYLPEYMYLGYLRLSDRIKNLEFKLKKNRYSTFNNRVHFTPLWYPDEKYTTYTRIIDVWTPAGHLYVNLDDYINIKGSVLDDYKAVPSKVNRR